jgi:hypothetical protein
VAYDGQLRLTRLEPLEAQAWCKRRSKDHKTMTTPRQKMLEKVRALLAKTIENGCTESEAMAALAKAHELMAAYDIEQGDLAATVETESATVHKDFRNDPYQIKRFLCAAVGRFTRCRAWRGNGAYSVGFAGLDSDVIFATWLLDTLQQFVMRELKAFQAQRRVQGLDCPRIVGASFVQGCAERIAKRLAELAPKEPETTSGNALVVSRKALIAQALKDAGIDLVSGRRTRRRVDAASYGAGVNAGNSARFDKPVSHGGVLRIA